jgi:hypothetical protein
MSLRAGRPRPYRIIMENIGRYLMIGGMILFVIGGLIFLASKFGLPFGRLPGDIRIERENFSLYFPLTSMILISAILTILINVIRKFLNK